MREHGVLNRILLVYEEGARRLEMPGRPAPTETIAGGARIIRSFIEDYHERLEEDELFPRFEKAHALVDLVATLRRQHDAGRQLTDAILGLSATGVKVDAPRLIAALRAFIRMYRPHEAREDTVLFPALRKIVSADELDELGERFEDRERQLFGEGGFGRTVNEVAALERTLGIEDLNRFTP